MQFFSKILFVKSIVFIRIIWFIFPFNFRVLRLEVGICPNQSIWQLGKNSLLLFREVSELQTVSV